jgi:hypothetical protein
LKEWYLKQPNVAVVLDGRGMGWDAVCVSLHASYSDFAEFIRTLDSELSDLIVESQTFHADLKPGVIIKPFSLKYYQSQNNKSPKIPRVFLIRRFSFSIPLEVSLLVYRLLE